MTKTRKEINREYYLKNKQKLIENQKVISNKKKEEEKEKIKTLTDNALNNNLNYITIHYQHLHYIEKDGKYTCECGGSFRKGDQARHSKTKNHSSFVQKLFREEYTKMNNGEPNRINELIMEKNHVIVKNLFYNI